ncbi:allosteric NADP-dependent malic enzyme [Balneicella halophila]|uniref:Allosteric NADP-dependent malic enzyme n=1 Tax=Balneicella halophila TaxID=1537566 RepID=A0A7L4US93_BALHA|nr:NADP-dependent malic enzyme [Balneicella halophila]PVX52630.1 allosteric NADP-dependent malic enzyme [Balneicella halophila]
MSTPKITKADALKYHEKDRPGKIEVVPTKPYRTQRDLALAYSPGVAEPCLEIQKDTENAYRYTGKSNLVGVISNGTAVLGLGDIGAEASKPVMEGKGLLFKIFADIDVFDIEVNETNPDKFITAVKAIAPTFGGINLEDIKAPECFEIEERLKEELDIPVMHDDQHGTAIISAAGLINALHLNGKKIEDIKIVVNGAGAAAVSCTRLYMSIGAKPENIVMCDSKGVINRKRENLSKQKKEFITDREIETLKEALVDADMFLGLSVANLLTEEMLKSMAPDPIIFALANPNPEVTYDFATTVRPDVIMATGRSDYPNQINNVLGFPYIFRGALDVRAKAINEDMKIACVNAIAALSRETVPESVNVAYNEKNLIFGKEYIVPKALDPRLIATVATAVAKAAIKSGVARKEITDWEAYQRNLNKKLGIENELLRKLHDKAKRNPKRVVFPEGDNYNIIKAAHIAATDKFAHPVLLGNKNTITRIAEENDVNISDIEIIDVNNQIHAQRRTEYAMKLSRKREREGFTFKEARERLFNRNYFAAMMVEVGDADAMITGHSIKYRSAVKIADQVIGKAETIKNYTGVNIMMTKHGPLFFADTTIESATTVDTLISTTMATAELIKRFNITPRIAMLSYANFGAVQDESSIIVHKAVEYMHTNHPELIVDGEISVDFALNNDKRDETFPFTKLKDEDVNTLIFPTLDAANISYKLLKKLGDIDSIGPILVGAAKPIHIVPLNATVRNIVNMIAMAVVDAQKE